MTPYYQDEWLTSYEGDAATVLSGLDASSVHCVVTSPPYWQQRDYGDERQIGLELTPEEYVTALVDVFREVRRVLDPAGSLWLNLGDAFAASGKGGGGNRRDRKNWRSIVGRSGFRSPPAGYKMKDLTLTPFQVAHALRADGWYLRQVIIWSKPAATEPMRLDRPASSHEYIFLLARSEQCAARDPNQHWNPRRGYRVEGRPWWGQSVWNIRSDGDSSHQAMMPTELASRCILAGSQPGQVVLDPFAGSGTVGIAAGRLSRRAVLIDLNGHALSMKRNAQTPMGLAL